MWRMGKGRAVLTWLGVAGLVGVAGTGVAIARQERQRRAYTPDEVRERLHQRHAELIENDQPEA